MDEQEREKATLARLVEWAGQQARVRAMLLTSSRADPNAPRDRFSDYDVILYVTDTRPFRHAKRWLADFGPVLVTFRDQRQEHGRTVYARLALYKDGTKIDFTISPLQVLQKTVEATRMGARLPDALEVGYRILVDKDGLAAMLPPPGYMAHIPAKPSAAMYLALVEEFWWESTYVAKNLRRGELLPAKYSLESVMKMDLLVRMLEWRVECDYGWAFKPGNLGRGLRQRLDSATWSELESTFAGGGIVENWQALERTAALFRRIAWEVGERLSYSYPQELEEGVRGYWEHLKGEA